MDRKSFFKTLLGGIAGLFVAPKFASETFVVSGETPLCVAEVSKERLVSLRDKPKPEYYRLYYKDGHVYHSEVPMTAADLEKLDWRDTVRSFEKGQGLS